MPPETVLTSLSSQGTTQRHGCLCRYKWPLVSTINDKSVRVRSAGKQMRWVFLVRTRLAFGARRLCALPSSASFPREMAVAPRSRLLQTFWPWLGLALRHWQQWQTHTALGRLLAASLRSLEAPRRGMRGWLCGLGGLTGGIPFPPRSSQPPVP